jgi:hypothetical protein
VLLDQMVLLVVMYQVGRPDLPEQVVTVVQPVLLS